MHPSILPKCLSVCVSVSPSIHLLVGWSVGQSVGRLVGWSVSQSVSQSEKIWNSLLSYFFLSLFDSIMFDSDPEFRWLKMSPHGPWSGKRHQRGISRKTSCSKTHSGVSGEIHHSNSSLFGLWFQRFDTHEFDLIWLGFSNEKYYKKRTTDGPKKFCFHSSPMFITQDNEC